MVENFVISFSQVFKKNIHPVIWLQHDKTI